MYATGFFLGITNLLVCLTLLVKSYTRFYEETRGDDGIMHLKPRNPRRAFRVSWHCVHIMILVPIAVVLSLGPFFGPATALKPAQRFAWKHKCDNQFAEIILGGPLYGDPSDATLRASFYLSQNNSRHIAYEYEMKLKTDANVQYMQIGRVQSWVVASPELYPPVHNISFALGNSTFSAYCDLTPGGPIDATRPCLEGSYQTDGFLTVTTHNHSTDLTSQLRAVDPIWSYPNDDDAPNFLVKEVQRDGGLGDMVVRTAVTNPREGFCTELKLCAARPPQDGILVVVGLALMKQASHTVSHSNPHLQLKNQQASFARFCSKPLNN